MILALLMAGAPMTAAVPATDKTPAAARAVVERYYDAIEHGRYRTAYLFWSNGGQASGKTFAAFVRGFGRTAHSRVIAGRPGNGEGAAGSLFIDVPVTVMATLKDGSRQRFRGRYTLRRVNDVDGATPDQLRWHFASAHLIRV